MAEASFSYGEHDLSGRDAILAHVSERFPPSGKHLCLQSVIEVDGDSATALSDVIRIQPGESGGWTIAGPVQYHDSFVQAGGDWKLRRRRVET